MVAALSNQERVVFRGSPVQHAEPQRARIEANDITVAKMAEARAELDREAKPLGIASRPNSLEENRCLESPPSSRCQILLIPDQGSVPVINLRRCPGRAQTQDHSALRPPRARDSNR
jgi:hypothetical protein